MMQFKNVISVLNDFGKFLVEEYKDNLILNNVNASDNLYNSVKYMLDVGSKKFEVKLELADYWKYVENGRKPGKWPPISAIEKWIEIKPVLPRPMANGQLPTNKQLAFLIARKIGLEGIKPRPILDQSIKDVWDVMKEFLEEALAKDVETEWKTIVGMRG
jgi:hypothetical protein